MPAPALAYFLSVWNGSGVWTDDKPSASGEYDNRQIAREWLKNQGLTKNKPSNGDAFDAVEDEQKAKTSRVQ